MFGLQRPATRDSKRVTRALHSANVLDQVVEAQLPLIAQLPEDSRRRAADYLAELVMLAQAYRHHASGWISRRELERRGLAAADKLAELRKHRPRPAQFTEQD